MSYVAPCVDSFSSILPSNSTSERTPSPSQRRALYFWDEPFENRTDFKVASHHSSPSSGNQTSPLCDAPRVNRFRTVPEPGPARPVSSRAFPGSISAPRKRRVHATLSPEPTIKEQLTSNSPFKVLPKQGPVVLSPVSPQGGVSFNSTNPTKTKPGNAVPKKTTPEQRIIPARRRPNKVLQNVPVDSDKLITLEPSSSLLNNRFKYIDRFIPNRAGMDINGSRAIYHQTEAERVKTRDPAVKEAQKELAAALGITLPDRILTFNHSLDIINPAPRPTMFTRYSSDQGRQTKYSQLTVKELDKTSKREVSKEPINEIEAPGFEDEFYDNNLAWASNDLIAITLQDEWSETNNSIHILNTCTYETFVLQEDPFPAKVHGLCWDFGGNHLAVGLANGDCLIYDIVEPKLVRTLKCQGDFTPLACLAWHGNLLATGNYTGQLAIHDLRIKNHLVQELESHDGRVCGLTWRGDGLRLASGGNDKLIKIFDTKSLYPLKTLKSHTAAVKGLAWCPWDSSLLASGGAENDHRIIITNTNNYTVSYTADTGSMVSSILWSPNTSELVASHGAPNNSFSIWTSDLKPVAEVKAHNERILQAGLSHDGFKYCTVASDTCLKFWAPFGSRDNPIYSNSQLYTQKPSQYNFPRL